MTPIKIEYSKQLVRRATQYYWWHSIGAPYFFLLIPFTAFLIYRIVVNDIAWFVWVIGLGVIWYSVLMIIMYVSYMSNALRWFGSMQLSEATLELDKEQLRIISDSETEEIVWSSICDVRHYNNFWVLVLSPNKFEFFILPTGGLTHSVESFIVSKIESVLYCTNQTWKIRAQLACSYLSLFFAFGPFVIEAFPNQWTLPSYIVGGVFAIVSLIYWFSIRCPKCRSNWNAQIAKPKASGRWPYWLFTLRKCSYCGACCDNFTGQ